jgi:uncharacterized protein
MVFRVLFLVVMIYLGLAVVIYLSQSRLLFLPDIGGRALVETPAAMGLPFESIDIVTDDGETLAAWWLPHPDPRGTLLFQHGNAGNMSHRLDSLSIFHRLGLNVLIYDYRGYGQSTGSPSEAGLYEDARAAWGWLVGEADIAPERIVLFGRSMGAAVAARLATEVNAAGLIVESSFSSVPDIAGELYWWLPVRWLARIKLATADYVTEADMPVLVVHSPDDEIIPFAHAQRIHEGAGEPRQLLEIRGDHNTGFMTSGDLYSDGLDRFLEKIFPD